MNKYLISCLLFLSSLLTVSANATPLHADEVFQLQVKLTDPNNLGLHWKIKPGYFLYKTKISASSPDKGLTIGDIHLPKSTLKKDSLGHVTPIYRDNLDIQLPILSDQGGEAILDIHFQGCADDGFCYPPNSKQVKLTINSKLELVEATLINQEEDTAAQASKPTDSIERLFQSHNWPMVLLIFFGLGLLLAFTPCVLPMVPVLSGIILGHSNNLSTRKAFFLSLSYVLAMALTYAIVGALIALVGANLQIAMQSPISICIFAAIFVLLAFSMFGYFEFKLPISWQAKLASLNRTQSSGHYLSAAIMGSLSILILSPCVTPPLIGALGYIANSGNIAMGSLCLFVLALGMGTPLLLIGASAGRWLPKAGHWMVTIKSFFGVLLLAVALSLVSRIISAQFSMILWGLLAIFTSVFMGTVSAGSGKSKFKQAIGIVLLFYGLCILFGAFMGNTNPLKPLENFTTKPAKASTSINQTVRSLEQLDQALEAFKGKMVILDFYADWCASCKIMEATTFKSKEVRNLLQEFILIKADITNSTQLEKALMQKYDVIAPPTLIFLNAQAEELTNLRLVGEISSEKLIETMKKALSPAP